MPRGTKTIEKKEKKETIEENKSDIKESLKDYVDVELKEELKTYIEDRIREELINKVEQTNKKIIKEKNKKILKKNIIIVILLAIIIFLLYILYDMNYFSQFFIKKNNPDIEEKNTKEKNQPKEIEEDPKPTLEELKNKYAILLEPITISEDCIYLNDFYNGNLTVELKNYIVFNQMDFNQLNKEEDYYEIDDPSFRKEYEKIWTDSYQPNSFDFNGNKIRYISKLNAYMTDNIFEKNNNTIKREIIDIKEEQETVAITTVEAIVKEGVFQNILTKEEIEPLEEESIGTYQDQLTVITYVFQNNKLKEIKKDR